MIVASARSGCPILMQSDFFVQRMQDLPQWQCLKKVTDEDMQKYHSIQLTVDSDWLSQMGVSDEIRPQACLVNVCCTGTVNMFVSISLGVAFVVWIEQRYVRMLNQILSYIRRFTWIKLVATKMIKRDSMWAYWYIGQIYAYKPHFSIPQCKQRSWRHGTKS